MEKNSVTSPRKGLIILTIIAVVAIILFGVGFGLSVFLKQTKSMYSEFNLAILDPYTENYLESEENLNPIKGAYPNTLTSFITTSSALETRLNYYLPYLIHIKFDKPTQKKANKLLKEFNKTKSDFTSVLMETKNDSLKTEKNAYLYYGAFLPQYKNYIESKFKLVKFIETQFKNSGFIFSDYLLNLNSFTDVFIELSLNIALPSIYVTNDNTNTLSNFIDNQHNISLLYLSNKFLEFKNTFKNNTDMDATSAFNANFSELKQTFNIALETFKKLDNQTKHKFLLAPKVMPSNIDPNSKDYSINFLLSYFANDNGKLKTDISNLNITNYFNF